MGEIWIDGPIDGLRFKIPDAHRPGDLLVASTGGVAYALIDGEWQLLDRDWQELPTSEP